MSESFSDMCRRRFSAEIIGTFGPTDSVGRPLFSRDCLPLRVFHLKLFYLDLVDDGSTLSWFCTSENDHTETNKDVEPMIDKLDEVIRTTVYFSSPHDWERLLDELQKTLHKGIGLPLISRRVYKQIFFRTKFIPNNKQIESSESHPSSFLRSLPLSRCETIVSAALWMERRLQTSRNERRNAGKEN